MTVIMIENINFKFSHLKSFFIKLHQSNISQGEQSFTVISFPIVLLNSKRSSNKSCSYKSLHVQSETTRLML